MNNSLFSAFIDKKFRNDKNTHKYAYLWTTKFYRLVNKCMRDNEFNQQVSELPHAVYFIKNYIEYFFQHGIFYKDISDKTRILFRGYKLDFLPTVESIHNAFISTTKNMAVAQEFSGKNGTVISFKTKHLPRTIPFVQITKDIAPHSSEDEIVFLPGSIIIGSKYSEYKPNDELINMYRSANIPVQGGAMTNDAFQDIEIDLRNKMVVWYRKVYNRAPDVIKICRLPHTVKKVKEEWKEIVEDNDERFENANYFIPEYTDLQKEKALEPNASKRMIASRKIRSFNVYTAIVDVSSENVNILTMHYGVPRQVFTEVFDISNIGVAEALVIKNVMENHLYTFKHKT